jgi:hypothetical protein
MYCPKCGQPPVSESVRYCPSCGFRLDGVVDLLVRNGLPVAFTQLPPAPADAGTRKRRTGMRWGAKLLLLSLVLTPIFFGFCFLVDSPAPLIVPLTTFLAGLSWLIYYRFLGEDPPPAAVTYQVPLGTTARNLNLPPSPVFTADPGEPVSITEPTTRFFNRQ